MPRITAPTVAEHRSRQRRAILDAARAHLAETGAAPTLAEVAARAGLARSSLYEYFGSREELLAAVVADVFPAWAGTVVDAMRAVPEPGRQVWAYVEANVVLFAGSERAVAQVLTSVVEPHLLAGPVRDFHQSLQGPLVAALAAFGEPDPASVADIVDSMVLRATRDVWTLGPDEARRQGDAALRLLARVLGPYLGLDASVGDGGRAPGHASG